MQLFYVLNMDWNNGYKISSICCLVEMYIYQYFRIARRTQWKATTILLQFYFFTLSSNEGSSSQSYKAVHG